MSVTTTIFGPEYDPERARAGILAGAGSWKGVVDAEALKANLRERRRPRNRPSVRHANKRIRLGRAEGLAKAEAEAPAELLALVPGAGSWRGVVDAEAFKRYIRARRRIKRRPLVRW